ncbi:transposase domain-containing protein, partial [Acidithiobacillus sp. MC2.2]|uniref:transposase domain-containing protein n=1 Tax=Acidithiobacillus sp. MC2.2 TaxID=2801579 RepID=UPI0020903BB2
QQGMAESLAANIVQGPISQVTQAGRSALQQLPADKREATAKAMDYSLNRWAALTRYLADPALPIDNNFDEQQIRPWATGRKNWLFAGTLLAGQRAAAIMSLIQTAKLNGHDPYAYLKDVLRRLPTQRANAINELLPHNWTSCAVQ